MNYLSIVWRGEERLFVTYWLFAVGGSVAISLIVQVLLGLDIQLSTTELQTFAFLSVAYSIFIMVAVIRSARNYEGAAIWRYLSIAAVVIGFLRTIAEWLKVFAL
jgi:hypothetical protein